MDGRIKVCLTTAVVATFSICASSNSQLRDSSQKTPDLKVTVIPEKLIFALHEIVYTRTEFRNEGTKTYCFPKPSPDCTNDFPGSVVTTGRSISSNKDFDRFICHNDGRSVRTSKAEIMQHWVMLAPKTVYLSDRAEAKVDLNSLGDWRLETTYSQPQGAFNPSAAKKYLTSQAESAGCILPPGPIKSEPVTIQVVDMAHKD
jgi:hypothetical protein